VWFLTFEVVLFAEPFNTSRCIHELLLTRKKRVAGRANFNLNILDSRAGFDYVTARAAYLGWLVFRVDFILHS
jgi:hypothetical protein